jgi:ABC-2 type transport system ATP-binding protein
MADSAREILIQAQHLRKVFGKKIAVEQLSLQVNSGEIYGLVGPDGAGKTTTIRLLCGALRPEPHLDGERPLIRIGGHDMLSHTETARAQIGYLPQRFSLYEELTVLENLRFFAEVRGLPSAEWKPRCMEILEFVGLDEFIHRRAGQLSGGMKQKLGLAAALVHRPHVLLLDEPTSGVDPVTRQDFWQLIIRLVVQEGVALLVSTPYMDEASRCTRVGFMRQGRLLVEAPPDVLRDRLSGRIVEVRGKPLALLRALAEGLDGVEQVQLFGDRLHLRVSAGKSKEVINQLKHTLDRRAGTIEMIRPIAPQLEDAFIALLE